MMTSKGLSSVIGAVFLILISVAAATSAWTFIDTITEQTQQNVEDQVNQQNRNSNSELTSEIAYNGTDGYTIVTLRNSGSVSLELQNENGVKTLNLYVRGRPVNGDSQSWEFNSPESGSVVLDPQESKPVNTTAKFPSRGEEYSIRFTGPYETSTTYICYNSGTASC
jgi:FlaG/FlaF family flagellin (archaellin)